MEEYKEVDFSYIARAVKRNKKAILTIFLLFILISVLYIKFFPKKYNIFSSIEIGQIENNLIESPVQLTTKIEKGIFGNYPGLSSEAVAGTDMVDAAISTKNNPEKAKLFLENLDEKIIESHEAVISSRNQKIQSLISALDKESKDLMLRGQQVADMRSQIINLQEEIRGENVSYTKIISGPIIEETRPHIFLILFAGGILGLFLGFAFALIREWLQKEK